MTDARTPVIGSIAAAAAALPGVHRLYPPTRTSALTSAFTAAIGTGADAAGHDLIEVDGTEARVAIAVTGDDPAPDTAARVHDLVLSGLVAAGLPVTVVHVRVVQID